MTTTKKNTPAKAKATPAGPSYLDLIKEAISTLKDRTGSSRQAIAKVVEVKKGASYAKARLNMALKKGVDTAALTQVKGSYKLAKVAAKVKVAKKKPAAKKKSVTKKAAPKKTTAKSIKPTAKKTTSATKSKKPTAKKTTSATKSKKPVAKKTKTVKKTATK